MDKTAIVTGAGSGVGRAVAVRLLREGWSVALVGRTVAGIEETRTLAASDGARAFAVACDVADANAVERAATEAIARLGSVVALVNSAGTNVARRALNVLSDADFQGIVATNLNGTYYFVRHVLPVMRNQGRGTIVNIVSDAGLHANATAGGAYVASKFAVTGLTQSINAEERHNGIRACAISPGEIATPILDKRPVPPPPERRAKMLQPEDLADCVMLCLNLPDRAVVEQLVVRPR